MYLKQDAERRGHSLEGGAGARKAAGQGFPSSRHIRFSLGNACTSFFMRLGSCCYRSQGGFLLESLSFAFTWLLVFEQVDSAPIRTGSLSISSSFLRIGALWKGVRFHGFRNFFGQAIDMFFQWMLPVRQKWVLLLFLGHPSGLKQLLTFTWAMWYTNELFRTSQKERKEGRKEESCCVLKYRSSILYVVQWISFASSRPMVDSGVCVCGAFKTGS